MIKLTEREKKKLLKEPINLSIGRIKGIAKKYGDERLLFLITKISADLVEHDITPF